MTELGVRRSLWGRGAVGSAVRLEGVGQERIVTSCRGAMPGRSCPRYVRIPPQIRPNSGAATAIFVLGPSRSGFVNQCAPLRTSRPRRRGTRTTGPARLDETRRPPALEDIYRASI